jgi:aminomethyltransferase
MGQAFLTATDRKLGSEDAHFAVSDAIETLIPGEIRKLHKGGLRYTVLLNERGGVVDDLMIGRPWRDEGQGTLFLVVNAATKAQDFALLQERLRGSADLALADRRSLLALQGPAAASALESILPGIGRQTFMTMRPAVWRGAEAMVSRSGYTGEDGFEVSLPEECVEDFARALLAHPDVKPIGLGARDSLRLEAGLCLYGRDLNAQTSPIEANLAFVVGKRRREDGGFPGAERIRRELAQGPSRLRVGIRPDGRTPAREGVEIQSEDGARIGEITSGGFGPTVNGPIAMGYVDAAHAANGTRVQLMVRGRALRAAVVDLPFVPHRYFRG